MLTTARQWRNPGVVSSWVNIYIYNKQGSIFIYFFQLLCNAINSSISRGGFEWVRIARIVNLFTICERARTFDGVSCFCVCDIRELSQQPRPPCVLAMSNDHHLNIYVSPVPHIWEGSYISRGNTSRTLSIIYRTATRIILIHNERATFWNMTQLYII